MKPGDYDGQRTGSEFFDLNQILMQNLNINNMSPETEGGANELNVNHKINEEDEGDMYYEENQEAQNRLKVFRNQMIEYYNEAYEF